MRFDELRLGGTYSANTRFHVRQYGTNTRFVFNKNTTFLVIGAGTVPDARKPAKRTVYLLVLTTKGKGWWCWGPRHHGNHEISPFTEESADCFYQESCTIGESIFTPEPKDCPGVISNIIESALE
jgi:hypothetical protein